MLVKIEDLNNISVPSVVAEELNIKIGDTFRVFLMKKDDAICICYQPTEDNLK